MSDHRLDLDVARYVNGQMSQEERRDFDRHVLGCERCWTEVRLDREGRRLVEAARDVAPVALRDRVRATLASAADPGHASGRSASRGGARRRIVVPALVAAALLVAAISTAFLLRPDGDPGAISAAVAMHAAGAVEHAHDPVAMPDLSALGLHAMGAERMALDDLGVEAVAYRSAHGRRLTLFMAHEAFPEPPGASPMPGDGWQAMRGSLGLASASVAGHGSFLIVTDDPSLMHDLPAAVAAGTVTV